MCIVGMGSFYIEKYNEAYEAFLLVLEFIKSTKGTEWVTLASINP
jgi:hypothetical protein